MYRTAYNPGDKLAVISSDGRTIGGYDWGTVDTTDDTARRLIDTGALILVNEEPGHDDLDKRFMAARDRTSEIGTRSQTCAKASREDLFALAVENGLYAETDDMPPKGQLVSQLAHHTDIDLSSLNKQHHTPKKATESQEA